MNIKIIIALQFLSNFLLVYVLPSQNQYNEYHFRRVPMLITILVQLNQLDQSELEKFKFGIIFILKHALILFRSIM